MRIGIVSDTHGHVENARRARNMLDAFEVDAVLHCGDIGSVDVVAVFRGLPTHFVFGNVDTDPASLRGAIRRAELSCHERFGALELGGVSIALLHGDDDRARRDAIESGSYRMVCSGHTHVPLEQWHGDVLTLNPGALYRAKPHTLAIVELPSLEAEIISL